MPDSPVSASDYSEDNERDAKALMKEEKKMEAPPIKATPILQDEPVEKNVPVPKTDPEPEPPKPKAKRTLSKKQRDALARARAARKKKQETRKSERSAMAAELERLRALVKKQQSAKPTRKPTREPTRDPPPEKPKLKRQRAEAPVRRVKHWSEEDLSKYFM